MGNVLTALSLLLSLTQSAAQLTQAIQQAQASGVDITPDQLQAAVDQYNAAVTQLNKDIAAAQAAGK